MNGFLSLRNQLLRAGLDASPNWTDTGQVLVKPGKERLVERELRLLAALGWVERAAEEESTQGVGRMRWRFRLTQNGLVEAKRGLGAA